MTDYKSSTKQLKQKLHKQRRTTQQNNQEKLDLKLKLK
jgi:hypothetical protein